jgi:hypothetical protein
LTESFLHYVWQLQYFDKASLTTTEGEVLQILNPGIVNKNSGPDFLHAKIRIGDLEWRGNVEIHIQASGWYSHRHHEDKAYENVVLHVVWENDKPVLRNDGSIMPTLELQNITQVSLWNQYRKLITSSETIPCAASWNGIDTLAKVTMLDRVLTERLELKAKDVLVILNQNNSDWEETCYQTLFKNFGFKVNTEPMLSLAKAIPYKVLLKHSNNHIQVEALLFGMAGLLEGARSDAYVSKLKQEFTVLSYKYGLQSRQLRALEWRFLRMRPANFPTLRIAQLAALLTNQKNIASRILSAGTFAEIDNIFTISQSDYWHSHYHFGKEADSRVAKFGKISRENILINTVAPFLTAYGLTHDDTRYVARAIDILQHLPTENNVIIRHWKQLGSKPQSAYDSQALIELYNSYCQKRRCLDCTVGSSLIRPE